jgi:chemotaxis protein histidine kinase CheA
MAAPHEESSDGLAGASMDDAMAAFRARARATNLQRVEAIADALVALRDGVLDAEARVRARGAAHSLAGSAGTFGFDRASDLARSVEAVLDEQHAADLSVAQRGLDYVAQLRTALSEPALSDESASEPVSREGSP